MNNQEDVEVGQIVWLRPATKTASSFVHRRLRVMVVDIQTHWPVVEVEVRDRRQAGQPTIRVHKLDIVLRPSRIRSKGEGDGANQAEMRIPKPAYRPHKPLILPDQVEQGELW